MEWFSWELIAALVALAYAGYMDLRVRRLEIDTGKKTKQIEWLQGECRSLRAAMDQSPAGLTAPSVAR